MSEQDERLKELIARMRRAVKNCMNSWETGECIEAEKATEWADELEVVLAVPEPEEQLGTCEREWGGADPHKKCSGCVRWKPLAPAQQKESKP